MTGWRLSLLLGYIEGVVYEVYYMLENVASSVANSPVILVAWPTHEHVFYLTFCFIL